MRASPRPKAESEARPREVGAPDDRLLLGLSRATIAAGVSGALALAVYLATLAPTVLDDDSGELVCAAHVLGITHPTGYPVYVLLAKLFDLLPFGNPAVRVGLLSAVCGAGAAAAIAWTAARITTSAPAGLLAGLVAALNGPMWSQATEAEVYALNALIVALAVAAFVAASEDRRPRAVIWLAFITGLGLAHHRTAAFFTVPLLFATIMVARPGIGPALKTVAAGLAPLLFYLYLPIRSAAHPPVIWNDLTRWENLLPYLSGEGYRYFVFARPAPEMAALAWEITKDLASALTLGGLALAAVGVAALLRPRRALSVSLLIGVGLLSVWNLGYDVGDVIVFFIPCALAVALWTAAGMSLITRFVERNFGRRAPWAPSAVTGAILLFVPVSLIQCNLSESSHRGEWKHYDAMHAIFAQIPSNGIYVTNRDPDFFIPMYLQIIEGKRPDILVLSTYGTYDGIGTYDGSLKDSRLLPTVRELVGRYRQVSPLLTREARGTEALHFAIRVAEATQWSRPVYCGAALPGPPSDLPAQALWWDLFHVTREKPDLLAPAPDTPAVTEFADGISLAQVSVEPQSVRPRQVFRIRLAWRLSAPLEEAPFVLLSLGPDSASGYPARPPGMLGRYGLWLAYGIAPLPPTPPGKVYEQEVVGIAPTGAPAGIWTLWVGIGGESGERMEVPVRQVAEFEVMPAGDPGQAATSSGG